MLSRLGPPHLVTGHVQVTVVGQADGGAGLAGGECHNWGLHGSMLKLNFKVGCEASTSSDIAAYKYGTSW